MKLMKIYDVILHTDTGLSDLETTISVNLGKIKVKVQEKNRNPYKPNISGKITYSQNAGEKIYHNTEKDTHVKRTV
jgi:hypothetical protein